MKSYLSVALAVMLAMVLVTGAFAQGPGAGMGPGAVGGKCPMVNTMTPEQQQNFTKFQNEILPLKQRMIQLRTELRTLRSQTPTDWNAVSTKQKEMVDVRIEIQKKAADSGFSGCGMGRGMSPRGGMRGGNMRGMGNN
jgi:Spy/CpxP family protein refolding chaperone